MMSNHFLIGGAQRSGTTLLYHLFDQHPEIEMARPVRPEPKYFLRDDAGRGGVAEYRRKFFGSKAGARVFGEKSTSYMERQDAAMKAVALLPEVKVVFVLRDPVERALSNYGFSVVNGAETASLEDALKYEVRRSEHYDRERFSVSPFAYLGRGHYHRFLDRWQAAVGHDRLRILLFEHLIRTPAVIQPLFHWLGVDPRVKPVLPPSPLNPTTPLDVKPELRRQMIDHFRESNRVLEARYGLDLSRWLS